jgi:hypothetical protein
VANNKTTYLEDKLINHVLRATAMSSPATVYVALFTAAPGEAGGGTEVSGGDYARQPVTFEAPVDGATENDADVTFDVATADWGTVTHFAIFDALTVGNMLYYGTLTTARVVNSGDQAKFLAGALDVAEL